MLILILVIIKHLKNYLEIFITKKTTIDYVERKQDEITGVMDALKAYAPRDNKYIEAKNKLVNNVENFYKVREKIIEGFKNGIFPVYYGNRDRFSENEDDDEEDEEEQDKKPFDLDDIIKLIINREKLPINDELFKKHFKLETPILMHKVLYETKIKKKKSKLLNIFNGGLEDSEKEIKEMSKEEIETEKPYNIVKVVKKILDFNKIEQQEGQSIKILTPNQMLNRLPIALAQLQGGNNSKKLKNEIRQLLYSLDRSKNMTEQVYKSLIGII